MITFTLLSVMAYAGLTETWWLLGVASFALWHWGDVLSERGHK